MSTKERLPQLKTLEKLIVELLKTNSPATEKLRLAYEHMYTHYVDEDFLHHFNHRDLLETIYEKDFYKYHNASALQMKFHLDNKTLTEVRKNYILLFSKTYLDLSSNDENYRLILYTALKRAQRELL